jgi:peptidoglycan/xylan/chitin deacetylase (PgdA/CDA1 family)
MVNRAAAGTPGPARDLVGYGRRIPRVRWPGDAHVAVSLVINYEEGSEVSFATGDGRNEDHGGERNYPFPSAMRNLAQESVYEYGSRTGIWRLLRILDEYALKATIFACALAFEQNPAVAQAAKASGHDLVSHGWRWVEHWTLSREEEAAHIRQAVESFQRSWGERPVGWYCRYGPSVNTRELIVAEGGFLYDCDAYNDDLPYFTQVNGTQHLVIPYSQTYNDLQGDKSPALFLDYCKRGIDELWLEGERGFPKMMSIGLHPRIIGQAGRTSALREFIEHAKGKGKIWFAGRSDIAQWWLERNREFTQ